MTYLYNGDFLTDSFRFRSDPEKCIHCGRCMDVCSSQILFEDPEAGGEVRMRPEVDGVCGWAGCYRCQRCMAVCPTGAISILGKDPQDSVTPDQQATADQLAALMRMRRSCRNFLDKEVPREEIDEMLQLLENVPTGSNRQSLEFSVVYEKETMDKLRKLVHDRAFELAEEGVYPGTFNKTDWECQIALEPTRNHGDMFFLNAPHILVVSSPKGVGCWHIDPFLAASWFDLICASRGIGCIIETMPVGALSKMPEVRSLLGVPEERYFGAILAFGYPAEGFVRGVQREGIMTTHEIKL